MSQGAGCTEQRVLMKSNQLISNAQQSMPRNDII